ncbi:MAG: fluoride efflux transporter CrcB [Hahellaceae bacterium]|nr:fluoride efflux transporter CrcB [Hahellaceae bacterium]
MLKTVVTIAMGASIGAVLRWWLGVMLNSGFPSLPLGTLVANLLGGYLIGIAFVLIAQQPTLAPEWRLLIITGFLGGLTTFSTFSLEAVTLIQQGRLMNTAVLMLSHVGGSVAMTLLGIASANALRSG